jgi:exportin-7
MVASVPYVKATEPHLLETYTPEVSNAYITSRLESVAVVVRYFTLHLKYISRYKSSN